jgi:adenine-specific DNA methylase
MDLIELSDKIQHTYESITQASVFRNSNLINSKAVVYPVVAFDLIQIINNYQYSNYTFQFVLAKQMNSDFTEITEDYQNLINIFEQGIKQLEEDDRIDVIYPVNYQCNSLKFADVNNVLVVDITLQVENTLICE